MNLENFSSGTLNMSQSNENSQNVEFKQTNWNCVTSKAFLACYFKHFKEEEESRDGTIRSKTKDNPLKCSPEEYQQSLSILREGGSHEQLCKCLVCLKMYQDHNVEFLFGINNIEYLPTEMLVLIFKRLTSSERRVVVSECCKRFLDIWLCDDFIDDRRLVFDCCVLDFEREPLSVFMKSSRIHHTLAFGDVRISEKSKFTEEFAKNVTTVELLEGFEKRYDERVNERLLFLSQFPNLKTIEVAKTSLLGDFSNVPTTIELLVIYNIYGDGEELSFLKSYLDRTCDSFRVELCDAIKTENIFSFTESHRKKIQRFYLDLEAKDETFKLPRFDNLKSLGLVFEEDGDFGTEDILDNLEEQCPAIKNLSIDISDRLPHKNWACLKTLDAWLSPTEELSRLSIFGNLKELTLRPSDECFFVHEAFLNKDLKTLKIDSPSGDPCFTCFQRITKSFPNLESFTCDFEVTNNHLEELAINTPKLEYLELEIFDPLVSFERFPSLTELKIQSHLTTHIIETWPVMLQLRKFDFQLSRLTFETAKFFERMPALENLRINCYFIDGDQVALFDALTKPLKRLEEIFFGCIRIQSESYPKIIDAMANNCKYLKRINFDNNSNYNYETQVSYASRYASEEILEQLLLKHSSLRCIDNVWLK